MRAQHTLATALLSLALGYSAVAGGGVDATVLSDGQQHRVQVRHLTEGWSWQSSAVDGTLVPHEGRRVTVADLDDDGSPEVLVTIDDQAPGGRVHVFRRQAGAPAFEPVMSEVGPGMRPRAFLVWDVSNGQTAPVSVAADGEIRIRARDFGMLGVGEAMATYRYRMQGGLIRLVAKVPDTVQASPLGSR